MTAIQSGKDSVPNTSINGARARSWRFLGWVTATYCLLALIVAAFFLSISLATNRVLPLDVDWSSVPAQAKPSLLLTLLFPLWLPVAVFVLTAPAAVGCFRYSRGRDGRALLFFYAFAMVLVCVVHVGAQLHLKYMGPVQTGLRSSVLFTSQDVLFALLSVAFLLLPVVIVLIAMRSTHAVKQRDTQQAHRE